MASLKCSGCGYGIHYHDEPDDTEYIFCELSKWEALEEENMASGWLEFEHDNTFVYAWKCAECGTFAFFDRGGHVTGVYKPNKEFASEPMQEPAEFGLFFDDVLWYDITEEDIPASEILKKYPKHLWLMKNDDEMRVYEDRARTKCLRQYRRIPVGES